MSRALVPLCIAVLAALALPAAAHPLAPALLEVRERPGGAEVLFRQSLARVRGSEVRPQWPPACAPDGPGRVERVEGGLVERFALRCDAPHLTGLRFGVGGLEEAGIDALLRVVRRDGRVVQAVLRAGDASRTVPAAPRRAAVARDYARLGVLHIATGVDHLLFVLGLMLLVGRDARRLVATVTAFTAGHSVTLALAALGAVRVPTGPVELAIAGSVFVLALELGRRGAAPAARAAGLARRPWLLAAAFGLLHGLGFAGALAEVGLPEGEIPLALLAFNAGIEAGQLLFVAVAAALALLAARAAAGLLAAHDALPRGWLRAAPAWTLGTLSAWWCFQRAAAWLG